MNEYYAIQSGYRAGKTEASWFAVHQEAVKFVRRTGKDYTAILMHPDYQIKITFELQYEPRDEEPDAQPEP